MVFEFKFPDVGEGITEGKLVKWRVKEGDQVKQDQVLAEVETDKAIVEIPAPQPGLISRLHAKEGETIYVGNAIVTFDGEHKISDPKPSQSAASQVQSQVSAKTAQAEAKDDSASAADKAGAVVGFLEEAKDEAPKPTGPEKAAETRQAIIATLAVKKLAKDLQVNINNVRGTGPSSRITEDDVKKAAGSAGSKTADPKTSEFAAARSTFKEEKEEKDSSGIIRKYDFYGYIEHVPMNSVRKATSHKMVQSAFTIPHVTLMDDADITELYHIREREKKLAEEKGVKLTYLPFIVKAVIAALKIHPLLNATIDEDKEEIIVKKYYNIGIAVDTPDGLIVPVVKRAEGKNILQLADEISKYTASAKERKVGLSDMKGGSFTITNLGAIRGNYFTPIINHPEVAVLGLGRLQEKPLAVDGKMEARKILPLSLSFDHRVVDGAEAARFMSDLIKHLEDPNLHLVED